MPSNQPPRPLTRPHHRSKSGGQPFLVAASPYVLRANRFLTFFSVCFLAFTFLFTLRSADQIESYARGGKDKIGKYATSHLSPSGIKCNPFRLPGWIEKGAPSQLPVWRTFSRDCAGVNRLSLLAQSGNAASNIPALAPLQNQTILILSDAIPNQNKLTSLCGIIGEAKTGRVDIGHPWGGILQSHKEYDPQGHGLGSYCYVPSIDLLIHHFPQGSIYKPSPPTAETRMIAYLPHLFNSWSATVPSAPSIPPPRKSLTPSLVIWGSSYGDDVDAMDKAGASLTEASLNHWRSRNLEALSVLDGVLSDAAKGPGRNSPVIHWQSPGRGDTTASPLEVSSATNLNPSPASSSSLSLTAPLYSAMLSLLDRGRTHPRSADPFFVKQKTEKKASELPARLKAQLEWRRVSEEVQDEATATAVWGEMILASLAEIV